MVQIGGHWPTFAPFYKQSMCFMQIEKLVSPVFENLLRKHPRKKIMEFFCSHPLVIFA